MTDITPAYAKVLEAVYELGEDGVAKGLIDPSRMRLRVGARKEEVRQLYDQGWTQQEIAKEVGVSQSVISTDLSETDKSHKEKPDRLSETDKTDSQLVQQSLSNEHYTPKAYIEAARATMGTIDLDPASCAEANKIVRATRFFDAEADGLTQDWGKGTLWLNPPYGDLVGRFIERLPTAIFEGVTAAIVLVNAHSTDAKWFKPLWNGLLCFTDHRINFYGDPDRSGSTHGSVFVYFGDKPQKFYENFRNLGTIVERYECPSVTRKHT